MWQTLVKPVADLFGKALDIVDDLVPDKDLAAKIKAGIQQRIIDIAHNEFVELIRAQSSIIVAEITGKSWLQRNWRPLLMAEFGVIILNNYIIAPYVGMIWGKEYSIMLTIPPDMWGLLKLGISGYIVGRSVEKVADGDGLKSVVGKVFNGK